MLGILLLSIITILIILRPQTAKEIATDLPQKVSGKLEQLWEIAQEALRDKKYLRAEKALLTILRVDERNATAYNRLGILYAKQQAFKDAIECFEIAQSLEPSASSLHNVGLIYFETGDNEKAALAFEQALELENNLAARYIAYAKVQEKLGHNKKMIVALERAVELDPIPQTLGMLADAYDKTGQGERANEVRDKARLMTSPSQPPKRIKQVRRVSM